MAEPDDRTTLAGTTVLITRPAAQADHLAQLIEQAGGRALRFPTIEIVPPRDTASLERALARLDEAALAVFVSTNAVRYTMHALAVQQRRWPARLPAAAVGQATAAALRAAGIVDPLVPAARFDTEGLLALPIFGVVAGKTVILFRGEGGRELLAQALRGRGARLIEAECYRRALPTADAEVLGGWLRAQGIDVVTATSVETLTNLHRLTPSAERMALLARPLVVVSQRIAEAAGALGFRTAPIISRDPSDEAILEAIFGWHQRVQSG